MEEAEATAELPGEKGYGMQDTGCRMQDVRCRLITVLATLSFES